MRKVGRETGRIPMISLNLEDDANWHVAKGKKERTADEKVEKEKRKIGESSRCDSLTTEAHNEKEEIKRLPLCPKFSNEASCISLISPQELPGRKYRGKKHGSISCREPQTIVRMESYTRAGESRTE